MEIGRMQREDWRRNGYWKDAEGNKIRKSKRQLWVTWQVQQFACSQAKLLLCYVILCTVNTLCHSSDMIPHYSSYTHPAECVGGWRLPGLTDWLTLSLALGSDGSESDACNSIRWSVFASYGPDLSVNWGFDIEKASLLILSDDIVIEILQWHVIG